MIEINTLRKKVTAGDISKSIENQSLIQMRLLK